MMGHEMKFLPERTSENFSGDVAHLAEPEMEGFLEFRVPPFGAILLAALYRIEGVGDVIDIVAGKSCVLQAIADRALRKLVRIVEIRFLAVLDAIEAFLLDRGDELAVNEQRGGRLVVHRIDSKNVHRSSL